MKKYLLTILIIISTLVIIFTLILKDNNTTNNIPYDSSKTSYIKLNNTSIIIF